MGLFLLTAPSGTGKTYFAHRLAQAGLWEECISHTTRPMRDGEKEGFTYYYVDKAEMVRMHRDGELAEIVEYNGNRYGVSNKEISRVMNKKKHVFIIVENDGYKQIKEKYPDAVGIFMYASKEDCMINMLSRGDSLENATERIRLYDDEIKNRDEYDYVLKNVRGKQEQMVAMLMAVIRQYNY